MLHPLPPLPLFRYGDVRHYDYAHDCTLTANYPLGRFVSEYGWQSYPSLETLAPVTTPADWNNNSTMMNHRQHHPDGNKQLAAQVRRRGGCQAGYFWTPPHQPSPRAGGTLFQRSPDGERHR